MGANDINAYISHLASYEHAAPSTQNQALRVLFTLYNHVLQTELAFENLATAAPCKPETSSLLPSAQRPVEAHLDLRAVGEVGQPAAVQVDDEDIFVALGVGDKRDACAAG